MVVHKFRLKNGEWSHAGLSAVNTASLKKCIEDNILLDALRDIKATVYDRELTVIYSDDHLDDYHLIKSLQKLSAKIAQSYVVSHSIVRRAGSNIIRYEYNFERTLTPNHEQEH